METSPFLLFMGINPIYTVAITLSHRILRLTLDTAYINLRVD